jgi:hypothetical protein
MQRFLQKIGKSAAELFVREMVPAERTAISLARRGASLPATRTSLAGNMSRQVVSQHRTSFLQRPTTLLTPQPPQARPGDRREASTEATPSGPEGFGSDKFDFLAFAEEVRRDVSRLWAFFDWIESEPAGNIDRLVKFKEAYDNVLPDDPLQINKPGSEPPPDWSKRYPTIWLLLVGGATVVAVINFFDDLGEWAQPVGEFLDAGHRSKMSLDEARGILRDRASKLREAVETAPERADVTSFDDYARTLRETYPAGFRGLDDEQRRDLVSNIVKKDWKGATKILWQCSVFDPEDPKVGEAAAVVAVRGLQDAVGFFENLVRELDRGISKGAEAAAMTIT